MCLKLYCDCFAAGLYCLNCLCVACQNREDNESMVMEKRGKVLQRDPLVRSIA